METILAYSGSPSDGPGRRPRRVPWRVRLYVVHVNVGPEVYGRSAEDLARWLAAPHPPDYPAYHSIEDDDSTVIGARDWERVNGAGSVAEVAYHDCIIGRADQSAAQWADDFSTKALERSAANARVKCPELGIPLRRITAAQVAAGEAGICGHWDVTQAYPANNAGHYDPGPHFPWDHFMELVRGVPVPAPRPKDDLMRVFRVDGKPHTIHAGPGGKPTHRFWNGREWKTDYPGVERALEGGGLATEPVAVDLEQAPGEIHLYAATVDRRWWHAWWTGREWLADPLAA